MRPATQPIRPVAHASLLEAVRLNHGPIATLGRYVVSAESYVKSRGVTLAFATPEQLLAANLANPDTWIPLYCVFDHRNGGINTENMIVILGYDDRGDVVAAGSARLYDWSNSNLHAEAASLRAFYGDPLLMKRPGEMCSVTAPSAERISGRVIYSGAAWYRPDFRGRELSAFIPRVVKAVAHGKWGADYVISFMTKSVHARGFTKMLSYTNLEWGLQLRNSIYGDTELAVLWMTGDEVGTDLRNHLAARAKIDRAILDGAADQDDASHVA